MLPNKKEEIIIIHMQLQRSAMLLIWYAAEICTIKEEFPQTVFNCIFDLDLIF
jgi:hypothetical protein